jgi:hypothetical protein
MLEELEEEPELALELVPEVVPEEVPAARTLTLISWFYKILWSHTLLFLNDR